MGEDDKYQWECKEGVQYIVDSQRNNRKILRIYGRPMFLPGGKDSPSRIAVSLLMLMNDNMFNVGQDTDMFIKPQIKDVL